MFIGQRALGESVTQKIHFSYSELRIDTITGEDSCVYNLLSYEDLDRDGELGSPALPIHYVSVPIPYLAENISLNVERNGVISDQLTNKLYPIQEEMPTQINNYHTSFVPCDSIIYNSSYPYPIQTAHIVAVPCIRNDLRFVRVAISPIQYYSKYNIIEFAEDVNITIEYTIPIVQQNLQTSKTRDSQIDNIGIPFYEYCIITSNALKDSFERLVAWRRQNGLNAGIVCKEDILNNAYIIGDTVSSIYDDAGKIRQYLQYAYNSGMTKYVLFGGNVQILPIRYGTGKDNCWTVKEGNDYKIPSDFYFSELTSNWKTDNDSYYGEPGDSLNYGGQLYVGRILCTTPIDVENYTNKLIRYELCPGNGETSYLTKVFFQQSDEMQIYREAQIVANALAGNFTTKTIIQEVPGPRSSETDSPKGKDIIDSMKTHYGYVNWYGHGQPYAIAVKTNSIQYEDGLYHFDEPCYIISVANAESYVSEIVHEEGNSLTCLENKDFPMFAYSISCKITPFDLYHSISEIPNMGQSFTLGKDYGGPVLVGNTRNGWTRSSHLYHKMFNNYIINEPVGKSLLHARASFCSTEDKPHYLAHSSNLIGCPYIRLWTDIPSLFSASLSYNAYNYILSANSSISDAEIGIRDITQVDETMDTLSFNPSQGAKNLTNVENSLITLTGKNCLPQIMPLTIQNDTLQGTHYAIVKDVICGKDVRVGTQGKVIFDEESDYTFETRGTFKLTKGVTIKQGAQLKVIPSEINY